MCILSEKKLHYKDMYAGTADIITGIEDFDVPDLIYDDFFHAYYVNDKLVPSVTQLLDKGEYKDVDPDVLRYAQFRGTLIHREIEQWLKDKKEGFSREFFEFVELFTNNKEMFGKKAIWDVKTYAYATKENKEKCYEQIKMYADAVEWLTGEKITQFYLIHLPKNRKGKIINLTEEFKNGE